MRGIYKNVFGFAGLQTNECSRRSVALRVLRGIRVGLGKDQYAHTPRSAHGAAARTHACIKHAQGRVLKQAAQRSLCRDLQGRT